MPRLNSSSSLVVLLWLLLWLLYFDRLCENSASKCKNKTTNSLCGDEPHQRHSTTLQETNRTNRTVWAQVSQHNAEVSCSVSSLPDLLWHGSMDQSAVVARKRRKKISEESLVEALRPIVRDTNCFCCLRWNTEWPAGSTAAAEDRRLKGARVKRGAGQGAEGVDGFVWWQDCARLWGHRCRPGVGSGSGSGLSHRASHLSLESYFPAEFLTRSWCWGHTDAFEMHHNKLQWTGSAEQAHDTLSVPLWLVLACKWDDLRGSWWIRVTMSLI